MPVWLNSVRRRSDCELAVARMIKDLAATCAGRWKKVSNQSTCDPIHCSSGARGRPIARSGLAVGFDRASWVKRAESGDLSMDGYAISFGPFRLVAEQRLLLEGDRPVRLGSRAFDILAALVERAAEVVGKEQLIARAWS